MSCSKDLDLLQGIFLILSSLGIIPGITLKGLWKNSLIILVYWLGRIPIKILLLLKIIIIILMM